MEPKPLLLAALLAATTAAGCLGGGTEPATVTFELASHPPDDSVQNRSDIDDFQTLELEVQTNQAYPLSGSSPQSVEPLSTHDLVDLAGENPVELAEIQVPPSDYEKWTIQVDVPEALHENGSRPTIYRPSSGFYITTYEEGGDPGPVSLAEGEDVTFRFRFAVTQDTEDIENPETPEGEYFLRTMPGTGAVR